MKKTAYYKNFKRKVKNGVVTYSRLKYVFEDKTIDFSILENVEINIVILGSEPGCFDLRKIYYTPTYTESKFIGVDDGGLINMI
jgi:hypothetical protein